MSVEANLLKELVGVGHSAPDELYKDISTLIGNSSVVLFGEATHGTHEFYRLRAELTKRLINEKKFNAVAVEADWPDAFRVNRYVRGYGEDGNAEEALGGFRRFPAWMWRNTVVEEFVHWLREHNEERTEEHGVGFYGLDLYSLSGSINAVVEYLERVDPQAAQRATERYSCFEMFLEEPQSYGHALYLGLSKECEDEAVAQLSDLRERAFAPIARSASELQDREEHFAARQNAFVVANAERYYRAMLGDGSTWNLRDSHMFETIRSLMAHLGVLHRRPKLIVWEHNSHIGDARATELGRRGELNVGQLVRQFYGEDATAIGFTTYKGSVTAATNWGARAEIKIVRPGLKDSYEELFHEVANPQFFLSFARGSRATRALTRPLLERAIGVVYRPETERASHYFRADMPRQFDGVIHVDQTTAVLPLEREGLTTTELPETYPTGL